MSLPQSRPRDIGHGTVASEHPQAQAVQTGVTSWIHDGACLTSAIDDLTATPASREKAPKTSFCFALHTDADPDQLLPWLDHNLRWAAQALEWTQCHRLRNSTPENDDGMQLPSDSVILVSAALQAESAQHALVEKSMVQVLTEVFKSPVECYVTCPGPVPLFHGSLADVAAAGPDEACDLLKQFGVTVLPGCLSSEAIALWQQQVEQQVELLEGLLRGRGVALHDNAIFTFREVAARGRHRFDARLDVGPLWQAPAAQQLRAVLRQAPWMPVVRAMLGEEAVTITSVVYARPGADAQEWHSDGPPAAQDGQPYAICVFVPLLQLTADTGCTQFWPGTHVQPHLVGFGPAAAVLETAVDGLVAAGDAVLYDYRTLHRGLPNVSEAVRRDVLQVVYHVKGYNEQRNYSADCLLEQ